MLPVPEKDFFKKEGVQLWTSVLLQVALQKAQNSVSHSWDSIISPRTSDFYHTQVTLPCGKKVGGDSSILINEGFKWSKLIPACIYFSKLL